MNELLVALAIRALDIPVAIARTAYGTFKRTRESPPVTAALSASWWLSDETVGVFGMRPLGESAMVPALAPFREFPARFAYLAAHEFSLFVSAGPRGNRAFRILEINVDIRAFWPAGLIEDRYEVVRIVPIPMGGGPGMAVPGVDYVINVRGRYDLSVPLFRSTESTPPLFELSPRSPHCAFSLRFVFDAPGRRSVAVSVELQEGERRYTLRTEPKIDVFDSNDWSWIEEQGLVEIDPMGGERRASTNEAASIGAALATIRSELESKAPSDGRRAAVRATPRG